MRDDVQHRHMNEGAAAANTFMSFTMHRPSIDRTNTWNELSRSWHEIHAYHDWCWYWCHEYSAACMCGMVTCEGMRAFLGGVVARRTRRSKPAGRVSHRTHQAAHALIQSRGLRKTSSVFASAEPAGGSALYLNATSGGEETSTRSTLSGVRPNLTPRS